MKLKVVQLAIGVDLIGSKTSITAGDYELEAHAHGVVASSLRTGRKMLIPWPNVKGCELLSDSSLIKAPAKARADQALAEARATATKQTTKRVFEESVQELSPEEAAELVAEARKNAKLKARKDAEASNK